MDSRRIYSLVFAFFPLAQYFWESSMFVHVLGVSSVYCWVLFHCMNASQFLQLLDRHLERFHCLAIRSKASSTYLMKILFCRDRLSLLLDKCVGVASLGHRVGVILTIKNKPVNSLPQWFLHFTFDTATACRSFGSFIFLPKHKAFSL